MKITKSVCLGEVEVEVSVTAEEITAALCAEADSKFHVLQGVNNCAQFLKAIPAEMIADLSPPQRHCIAGFLADQQARFRETEPFPTTEEPRREPAKS
jgi:hypothetical protein